MKNFKVKKEMDLKSKKYMYMYLCSDNRSVFHIVELETCMKKCSCKCLFKSLNSYTSYSSNSICYWKNIGK